MKKLSNGFDCFLIENFVVVIVVVAIIFMNIEYRIIKHKK
jgi:hypothetical protein